MKQLIGKVRENRWTIRLLPFLLLLVIVAFFTVMTGGKFAASTNLNTILNQCLVTGVVATGASFIFATGNINVAMGATTALTATLAANIYLATGSLWIMVVSSVAIGVLLMVLSAVLSTVLKVRIMFVTIVMMVLLASIQAEIVGGTTIKLPYELVGPLQRAPYIYYVFLAFFAVCAVVFHFTAVGRDLKILGSNKVFAGLSGISESRYLMLAFVIAGVGVGIASLIVIIRSGSITNTTCSSLNMDVVLALVLGGMPIVGGAKSKVYAGLLGALTVAVLNNGLLMMGVSSTIIQGVRGVLFLLIVLSTYEKPDVLP